MEKNNKDKDMMVCSCDNCQNFESYRYYHRYFWLRWLLGLVVIAMVFGLGLKVGEFKGYFESNFSSQGMRSYHMDRYYPMMDAVPSSANPSSSKGTSTTYPIKN